MRNTLSFLVLAALGAGWATSVSACGNPAQVWGMNAPPGGAMLGTVTAGEPSAGQGLIRRYSGRCGALFNAQGDVLQDGSPGNEQRYLAQFYLFTGVTGGTAKVFSARYNGSPGTEAIGISFDAVGGDLEVAALGQTGSVTGLASNRWYAVSLDFNRTATPDTLTVNVKGAGESAAKPALVLNPGNDTNADVIDYIQVGWISNGAGTPVASTTPGGPGNAGIAIDAFDSRRANAPARLCRGDANFNNQRDSGDSTLIRLEFLSGGTNLPNQVAPNTTQPDCNEDGLVNSGDATCIRLLFLGGSGNCATGI